MRLGIATFSVWLLSSLNAANAQADCSKPQHSVELVGFGGDGVTLNYVLNVDPNATGAGTFTAEVVYKGVAWVGVGFSSVQEMMAPSNAVIGGFDGDQAEKYVLTSRSTSGVVPSDSQTLQDHSFQQNETHSVLRFTKLLVDGDDTPILAGSNNIIWAYGASTSFGPHENRGFETLMLEACDGNAPPPETPSPTEAPTTKPTSSPRPTATPADRPDFQDSLQLSDGLVMSYLVTADEDDANNGFLTVELVCPCTSWVGFAVAESSAGAMVNADSVIGLPDTNEVSKYFLRDRNINDVVELEADRQTLEQPSIEQNETHTVLLFKKRLVEPNEIAIDGNGPNTFLWAYGFGNSLSAHRNRGAFELNLATGGSGDIDTPDSYRAFWSSHGLIASIAWGALAPLAIGSSMLRDLIPSQALWFKLHKFLNLSVLTCTIVAFVLAVTALQKGSVGGSPGHFANVTHRTVGLVIMVFVVIQVIGAFLRPHPPAQKEDGTNEEKATIRKIWEFVHKGTGYGLLGLCWWEVQEGIRLYSERFGSDDLRYIFWIVTGVIAGLIAIVWAYRRFVMW